MIRQAWDWVKNVGDRLLLPRVSDLPAGSDYTSGQAPGPATAGIAGAMRREGDRWPGRQSAIDDPRAREILEERIRSGPAGVVFPWFGNNQISDGSTETSQMRLDYRRMEQDPNVSAAVKGLIYSVATQDLVIAPAKRRDPEAEMHAAFVRWNLQERLAGGVSGLIWDILSGGLRDGYSLNYKVWGLQQTGAWKGFWPLRMTKAVDVGNDAIVQTDSHRNFIGVLGLRYNAGLELSPADFIYYRHCPNYNNPLGASAFRCVWREWKFLQAVLILRGIASEKRTLPFIWAQYRTASQQTSLQAMLSKLSSQNWAAVPEGVLLNALDIAAGSEEHFKSFMGDMQEWIFLGIQHATLQALTGGANEQRGSSKVHKSQTDLVRSYLSTQVEHCFNDHESGLIRDLIDLNFQGVESYPRATLGNPSVEELIQEAQLDKALQEIGLKLGKDNAYERYGRQPPEGDDDVLEPEKGKAQASVPGLPPGAGKQPEPQQPRELAGVKHAL